MKRLNIIKYLVFFSSGSNYYVRILSTIDRELLKTGASVALHKHSNALVDILPPESDSSISMLQAGRIKLWIYLYKF
jgi:26S proteasome regulatory subunit T3